MIANFNHQSLPQKFNGKKSELMMNTFIKTCRLCYQACETMNKKFYLYVNDNFFESPFIQAWINLKNRNSDDFVFLLTIKTNHCDEKNIFVSIDSDPKWSEPIITINGKSVKNMSDNEHVYEHLEYFPAWNNFSFKLWKPDFNADEKLLPIAKLSDYVWLKEIDKPIESYDPKKMKQRFWNDFVKILRHKPGGGIKEGFIISMFLKISSINGFIQSKVCKKTIRKIVEFPYKHKFYLSPDKQHGTLEVYNKDKVHQGEWFFPGRKNNKPALASRDICQ
ncbi:MAG: hypothetical protein OMM_03457 [Candidatus Magnetoglobus multicellularis str. Araruama]|uniref:Uncharacterized protein n=1 Tax=Candidatus Magnetoglobus multicellularis str. Araruama TaxID=890399 RepID=A0A1V1P5Q6_9BACT|nr:MAG: hypothetical protein OMM_03457 [Candidatus Magnetoglobus multicellularis str. Araruama]